MGFFVAFLILVCLLVLAVASILIPGRRKVYEFEDEDGDEGGTELPVEQENLEPAKSNSLVARYLVASTLGGRKTWMDYIGHLIYANTEESSKATDVSGWMTELVDEVWGDVRERIDLTKADENIAAARTMAVILTLWTARILKAKAYDARRSLEDRKQLLAKLTEFSAIISECFVDESLDRLYFPAQEWSSPYAPNKETT